MSAESKLTHSKYLWFDSILEIEKGVKARAAKTVSPAESFFVDHFPRLPVVPGMLQLEGLIQLGTWLVNASNDFRYTTMPHSIKGVDLRKFVRPGDRLILEAEVCSIESEHATVKAKAMVDGKLVARVKEINFKYLPLSPDQVTGERERFEAISGSGRGS